MFLFVWFDPQLLCLSLIYLLQKKIGFPQVIKATGFILPASRGLLLFLPGRRPICRGPTKAAPSVTRPPLQNFASNRIGSLSCEERTMFLAYLPTFTISRTDRKYIEGWTTDPGRDSALEYRLSIINAVKEDSGIYRCETPARQSHQVEIIVEGMLSLV